MRILFTLFCITCISFSSFGQNDVRATVKSNGLIAQGWIMAETAPIDFPNSSNAINMNLAFSLPANGSSDPGDAPPLLGATTPIPGVTVNSSLPVELWYDRFIYIVILTGNTPSAASWDPGTEHLVCEMEFGPEVSNDFPRLDHLLFGLGGGESEQGYFYFDINGNYRSDTEGDPFYGGTEGFYGGDGDSYVEAPAPLPITMIAFDAKKSGERSSLLTWTTVSEINSSHFAVQRSTDKKSWGTVGKVNAAGNSQLVENYNFVDQNVYNGLDRQLTAYYRLMMVDLDGQFKYSPMKTVSFGTGAALASSFTSSVYPNPTTNGVYVDWASDNSYQPTSIELYDVTGKLILTHDVAPESNQEYIDFTPVTIQPGLYLLRMIDGTEALDHQQIVVGQRR